MFFSRKAHARKAEAEKGDEPIIEIPGEDYLWDVTIPCWIWKTEQ